MLRFLVSMCILIVLSGCLPAQTPLPPEPTSTQSPTLTPTATIVWFPPTPTPTASPSPVVTPTLDVDPPVGEIILSDDFSDDRIWTLGQTASASAALGKNALTLALTQPDGYLYSLRSQPALSDFYAEINARPSLCRGNDEYGLLLRVSEDLEFYRFSLSCNGEVRLDKYYQGRASSPKPPELSGAFPPGSLSSIRLGVWASGSDLRFYINDQHQFSVRDRSLTSGLLGVFVRSAGDTAVTVTFSDLVIREINP